MGKKAQNNPETQREEQVSCLADWKKDLEKVQNTLVRKTAESSMAYLKLSNSQVWEGKLKTYWENVEHTNELIKEIISEMDVYKGQLTTVCSNTECVVDAVEILFCYLRDLFDCTDQLSLNLSTLINQINCLNEPNLGSSILLGCLKDLMDKLTAAIAGQKDILKLVVTILKEANMLHAAICDSGTEESCDFTAVIDGMSSRFDHQGSSGGPSSDMPDCPEEGSCGGTFTLTPVMPLENDEYYTKTKTQHEQAQGETTQLKTDYYDLLKTQKSLTDCKKSLSDAIDAAESAKSC